MQLPDEYWKRFEDKDLTKHATRQDATTPEDINITMAALAMVENIDYNVYRIMTKLRKLYLEDDTIVIYMSDNGPNSFRWNGNMSGIKGATDEGGVRSPLYIQWKDSLPEKSIISEIAGAVDLLPTLLKLAGISWPPPSLLMAKTSRPYFLKTTRSGQTVYYTTIGTEIPVYAAKSID